jgi:hypothetical protein
MVHLIRWTSYISGYIDPVFDRRIEGPAGCCYFDWFLKTKLGPGDNVRDCKFTNCCEGLDDTKVRRMSNGKRRRAARGWKSPQ